MTVSGSLTTKHGSTYSTVSPGGMPPTLRLCNIPGNTIETQLRTLTAIAPIVASADKGDIDLSFDISAVPKYVTEVRTSKSPQEIAATAHTYPELGITSTFLSSVAGTKPVNVIDGTQNATVYFDIISLDDVEAPRAIKRSLGGSRYARYNVKSVQSINGAVPIYVNTLSVNALVSFDMTSLPPV